MQARRISTSPPPPPSSPPFAFRQDGEQEKSAETNGVSSPTQTLWTAHPSPTQTLGHSSPELPPLPTLAALGSIPRTPSTAARHAPTDSTYYTASWGSPYQNPPPAFNRGRTLRGASGQFGSDDLEGDSSTLEFGLEHLLPPRLEEDHSPNRFNLEHLLPSRLPAHLAQTPTQASFASEATPRALRSLLDQSAIDSNEASTEWVRQFLAGHWNNETQDWVSDGSTAGSEKDNSDPGSSKKSKGHKSRKENLTLKQQDFWAYFSESQKATLGKMMASRFADPAAAAPHSRQTSTTSLKATQSPIEKAPSTPTKEEKIPESPKPNIESLPKPARKKIAWKGKACWISIPRDIPRGSPGYPPKPMSSNDVDAKMQRLEQAGLDTRGFGHWKSDAEADEHLAQNRAIWPNQAFILEERTGRPYRVRVPNKADWDAYVNYLTEQKLAALGVSLGGSEEEETTPATGMSRQASGSQHPGLAFSPPPLTSSAGSQRIRQGSVGPGSFPLGPSPGHASRQSIASPISAFGNPRSSMHMHRHSTFSPASFAQQSTSPGVTAWSPGQYFGAQGARGGSPALPHSRPDLSDMVSPRSPFGLSANQQFPLTPDQKDNVLSQMQQQQQQLQAQLLQQQQQQLLGLRPSSTLAEVPEDEAEEDDVPVMKSTPRPGHKIAVPTPRGHRHNISANLEREARDAEYHLEEAINKQFDEGGDFSTEPEINPQFKPSKPVNNSNWEEARPVLHQPQPHSRAHSLTKPQQPFSFGYSSQQNERQIGELSDGDKTNISDDDTNPSLEEGEIREDSAKTSAQHSKSASQASSSWRDSKFTFGKPGSNMHSKHTSRSSISKLNVDAKEFTFNPSASFSPSSFSSSFTFGQDAAPRSNKPSIDGLSSSFNIAAPAFTPGASTFKPAAEAPMFKPTAEAPAFKPVAEAPVFKPGAMNGSALPSTNFSFSSFSKGATFKPDAPAFNPSASAFNPDQPAQQAPPGPSTNFSSKIFGNVNISASDIVKPAKRSKAIPIVRPDIREKTPEKRVEAEEKEDEEGRIMPADGREKRARRGRDDGDDVPQFAQLPVLPSQPLAEASPFSAKQDPQIGREAKPEDKENLSPNVERAPSKSKSPEIPSALVVQREPANAEPSLPTPSRFELSTGSVSDSRTSIDDRTPHDSEAPTPSVEEAPKSFVKKHKSSLSATAKPFEFRPEGTTAFDFGIHVTKPSVAQNEDFDDSHISPPRSSKSPATTFRPSDDGSYKTALESRRHGAYPPSESVDFDHFPQASFNEIDEVMKHMNEEGSDFGVERDEPAWGQPSPRRSVHDFERNDLPPNVNNLRSDAPSPSPRRLFAQKNLGTSSTSITHDPFSDERAGLAYESPVHRLNQAEEVPMSDWDAGLTSEGEDKIQTRSRFFDSHVDDLIGRLLQSRLGPLERNLEDIHHAVTMMSIRPVRGRRSLSNDRESDADDEDDEIGTDSHYRNRSPRKDRRLEKMRSIVKEALEAHNPSVTSLPVPVPPVTEPALAPEKIREIVVEALAAQQSQAAPVSEPTKPEDIRDTIMEALAHHQPQWTPPKFEPVPAEQIRSIVEEAIQANPPPAPLFNEPMKPEEIRTFVAEAIAAHQPATASSVTEPAVNTEEIRTLIAEALAAHQPTSAPGATESMQQLEDIRSIVTEALATHQPTSEPVPQQIWPEDIKSIVAEALVAHQPQAVAAPTSESLQPDAIRSIVTEALESHKPVIASAEKSDVDLTELYQIVAHLKASVAQAAAAHVQPEDIREMIESALKRQNVENASTRESEAIEEKNDRIGDLEEMFKEANRRLEDEIKAREAIEAREENSSRLLRVTEEELALFKESSKDDENKLRALEEEVQESRHKLAAFHTDDDDLRNRMAALQTENDQLKVKTISLEAAEEDAKRRLEAASAENEALQFTLDEHRKSSDKWRDDVHVANQEKDTMRQAIEASRLQAEEATRVRESMRARLEKLQQDMTIASGQAAAERAHWQKSDEEHMKKYEILSARIEAEGRTRERLERELERLETQEREAMRLRITLEQAQKENSKLEEAMAQLQEQTAEHQKTAERYEREFREAREGARVEVRRTRVLMEADIEAANNQVNIVRADLDAEIARVRGEMDNLRMDADTAKEKHELDLEAASDEKKQALAQAEESHKFAIQEQQQAFDRRIELLQQEHARALEIAREDKERAEQYNKDRLALADSKLDHAQDKISLLEEKVAVAKEAATAAAQAAQSAKGQPPTSGRTSAYASGFHEKIDPQALRQSIAVLQEQLQERESRIESLEHRLSEVDTEAPNKLKERETEIGWLRELLGVRIDDLNDLINALAQPHFNRESVRDAAIRIRTNLQMEQQEKERLITGGQNFPTLATISNFASPKAVQLAAAFGNWRKGRAENGSSGLSGGGSASTSRTQTPSRVTAPSAQTFLSGLMTPPTSNLRRTPDLPSSGLRPQNSRTFSNSSGGSKTSTAGFAALGKQPVPSTPPLLRTAAYDQDAEDGHFSESGFYDDESTVDGEVTPIGLNFGKELER